eukprot:4271282-Amphidinium_carterae.1
MVSLSAGYSWDENPTPFNQSHSGSGAVPMVASARPRPTTLPQSSSHGAPTLADLRKVETTLPVLQLQGNVAFSLIKTWKEWTLAVQVTVASWNERFPSYWTSVLDNTTAAYSRFCSMTPTQRTMFEAEEQMRVIAGNYNTLVTRIVGSDKMLLDVMRRKLRSDSFAKLGVIDSVESRLPQPSNIAECSNKLRVYLQDLRIADGLLRSTGNSVQLDTTLLTKIVMLGDITEHMDIDQLTSWALHVRSHCRMFGSSPSNPKNPKSPQANAATPDPKGKGKGKEK